MFQAEETCTKDLAIVITTDALKKGWGVCVCDEQSEGIRQMNTERNFLTHKCIRTESSVIFPTNLQVPELTNQNIQLQLDNRYINHMGGLIQTP